MHTYPPSKIIYYDCLRSEPYHTSPFKMVVPTKLLKRRRPLEERSQRIIFPEMLEYITVLLYTKCPMNGRDICLRVLFVYSVVKNFQKFEYLKVLYSPFCAYARFCLHRLFIIQHNKTYTKLAQRKLRRFVCVFDCS